MNRKNGTKIQHKNPPKSTKNHKIDENRPKPVKNRRKSQKSTFGGFFDPLFGGFVARFDGPTIVKRTHLGEQNALFYGPFLFGRAIFTTESNTKNRPKSTKNPPRIAPVYI
jgi:hypothetical protein